MAHFTERPGLRTARDFLAGALITAGAIGAWFAWHHFTRPEAAAPVTDRVQLELPPPAAAVPSRMANVGTPAAAQPATARACAFAPILTPGGADDGQFVLDADVARDRTAPSPQAYVQVAREAAEAGRLRDGEVALIMACRLAARADGRSVPVADVQMLLAQLYGAADPALAAARERQRELLAASTSIYTAALGRSASKTRIAQERLAELSGPEDAGALGAGPPAQAVAAARPHTVRLGDDATGKAPVAATRREEAATPRGAEGSVRGDPQLAQLDADLQRLRRQAEAVSGDPGGLQRRERAAQSARNACGDKRCLLAWYARRRAELLDEF